MSDLQPFPPENLQAQAAKAVQFLLWLNPGAKLYFETMNSQGESKPKPKTYTEGEASAASKFVAANNSSEWQRNIYFLPNAEFLEGKRAKSNLKAIRFLHVDLDNKDYPGTQKEQEERILSVLLDENTRPEGVPHPTAVWFTGGGFQAVWRLKEPIPVIYAEELSQGILIALEGGPGTHDAGRLLRLCWTVNWLNKKKRETGRVPMLARPLHPVELAGPPVSFSVDDFDLPLAAPEIKGANAPSQGEPTKPAIEVMPLPDDLGSLIPLDGTWSEVILSGQNPPGKAYSSRSELLFAALLWMLGRGMDPGHVLAIIINPALGISAHVRDNPNPLKYAQRQIERALSVLETQKGGWPIVNDEGWPVANAPENIRYAFAQMGIHAQRNTFTQTDEVTGYQLDGRDLNDIGEILSSLFSRDLKFGASPAAIKRELLAVAHENRFHPVLDYLGGVKWDGVPRIDGWLATYCGAEDTQMNREFGSKLLIAGVRRIKQPGVKFDTMLVLEGAQGAGKSQLAAKLAVRDEWFCGSLDLKSDDKVKAELLSRAWIVECQELDGMNKTTSQNLKKFLSTAVDMFRPAYARNTTEFRRHCIILGTTNEATYLRDLTGNRRIWPVEVGEIDLARFTVDVDQLWAEAVARESEGESIVLSKHLWAEAKRIQDHRMIEDDYADVLADNFAERTGKVSMDSIKLLLQLSGQRMAPSDSKRIKAAMLALGWEYGTHRLHDLTGQEQRPRKGFARSSETDVGRELIASQEGAGAIVLKPHRGQSDMPF